MLEMPTIHTLHCPICGSNNFSPFLSCSDNLVTKELFAIALCNRCQFGFTQDFPSENEIGKYYEATEYISHSDTHKGIINKLYHRVRKISLNSKANLITKVSQKESGTLLDIGAGTGYFLDKVKHRGWIVTGIEKSEATRLQAKNKFGIECHNSEYLFELAEETIDIVSMWHVLEHVEKLNDTMASIHKILKKDGHAIIALPNKQSADAKHYKQDWAAYDVPRHLWHFSPSDFLALATKHGFELVDTKPMYFDGFYISMLSEQSRKTICASLVGLIKGGLFFLQSLISKNKSSSIIYILKKK